MTNEIFDNTFNGIVVSGSYAPKMTPECMVCEHLVKELEKRVPNKHSREQIKWVLDHACDKIQPKMKDKCINFMAKHEEQIIDLVMKGVAPKEFCTILGFCSFFTDDNPLEALDAFSIDFMSFPAVLKSDRYQSIAIGDPIVEIVQPQVEANEGCILCEFVMTKLEADLTNETTIDEVKQALDKVCMKMPKSVAKSCTHFINQYAETVLVLWSTTPPAKICQIIHMCVPPAEEEQVVQPEDKEIVVEDVIHDVKNDVLECAVCHAAVTFIDK